MPRKPKNNISVAIYVQQNQLFFEPFASDMKSVLGSSCKDAHINAFLNKIDELRRIVESGQLSVNDIMHMLGKHLSVNPRTVSSKCSAKTLAKNIDCIIELATRDLNTEPSATSLNQLADQEGVQDETAFTTEPSTSLYNQWTDQAYMQDETTWTALFLDSELPGLPLNQSDTQDEIASDIPFLDAGLPASPYSELIDQAYTQDEITSTAPSLNTTPPVTLLSQLIDHQLTSNNVAHILAGRLTELDIRIKHLQSLISPFVLPDGAILLDHSNNHYVTNLARIIKEGFTPFELSAVLHGTNTALDYTIEQLLKLVMPLSQTTAWSMINPQYAPSSALSLFLKEGISLRHISILLKLAHKHNVFITDQLIALASPISDSAGQPLLNDQSLPIIRLKHLLDSTLSPHMLIDFITKDYSQMKKRLDALLALAAPAYHVLRKTDGIPLTQWEYLTSKYAVPNILAQLSTSIAKAANLSNTTTTATTNPQGFFAYPPSQLNTRQAPVNHQFTPPLPGSNSPS